MTCDYSENQNTQTVKFRCFGFNIGGRTSRLAKISNKTYGFKDMLINCDKTTEKMNPAVFG
ncbi:hypothetical protein A9Q83_05430 [Alphaproteobacteria bacterium 46_93_T64]|nr:hypothetical protein A9Q83_05430 [Alphaproteobacteria bacterium 46_93_T64]